MSEPYLLTVSLLSVGPISAPPPPVLPPNQLDDWSVLLTAAATKTWESVVTPQIAPIVESIAAEFSPEPSNLSEWRTQSIPEAIPPVLTPSSVRAASAPETYLPAFPKRQTTGILPTSGSQLYLQRLAALKAGKLFTRLPSDSFSQFWAKEAGSKVGTLQNPTHEQWKRLLEQEAKAVAKGQGSNRLSILLGDSISLWFPSEGFPGNQLWLNQGISGENSGQILRRLPAFSQTRPDTIYVLAGINDLRQGASDPVILNNLRQIVKRLRQNHPQAQVILQSILPTRLSAIPNERIRKLNQEIAIIARQEGAGYLNLHSWFTDEESQMQQELTTDGIHLTRRGYEVWQEALHYAESVLAAKREESARKVSDRI